MEWAKPALNSLKLRGSWGIIGDQTVDNGLYVSSAQDKKLVGADGQKLFYRGTPSAVASSITWAGHSHTRLGI